MKTILLFLFSIHLLAVTAQTNETENDSRHKKVRFTDDTETLVNKKGGFGAFLEFNTQPLFIQNQPGIMMGGGFSLVFGHSLNLGFSGYGLISDIQSSVADTNGNFYYLQNGFGGMTIEPVLFSKKLVHVSFPILFGMGATSLTQGSLYDSDTYDASRYNTEMYFIARPGVNVEINLLRVLRLDLGIAYRFSSGYQLQNISSSQLSGLSGNIGIKLGWF